MDALSIETSCFGPGLELDADDVDAFQFDGHTSSTCFDARNEESEDHDLASTFETNRR